MPPLTQKLIAAVLIFVAAIGGLGYAVYAKTVENDETQAKIDALEAEISQFQAVIATREEKERQRLALDQILRDLVSILPPYSERQEELVQDALTAYASGAQLKPKRLAPTVVQGPPAPNAAPQPPRPPGAASNDFVRIDLRMGFEGTFFNFLKFLYRVETHDSFLRVDEIQLAPLPYAEGPQPENRELAIVVKVSTYQYVPK